MDSTLVSLLTGTGGAVAALGAIVVLFVIGKIHSDKEYERAVGRERERGDTLVEALREKDAALVEANARADAAVRASELIADAFTEARRRRSTTRGHER